MSKKESIQNSILAIFAVIIIINIIIGLARGSAVGWGTSLQDAGSRGHFPIVSL